MYLSLSLSFSLSCHCLFLVCLCLLTIMFKCFKGHKYIGSLYGGALWMYLSLSLSLSLYLSLSLSMSLSLSLWLSFFGQVMSPHHSDQMSQRSQDSRIALWWSSIIAFVFVFVYAIVCFMVMSCLLVTLIKCLKGHKSLGSLFGGAM